VKLALAALCATLAVWAAPVLAGLTEDRAALNQLQSEDLRLQSVGWRLATANARFCADARPAIGLLLQDIANYADPARMRAAAGISGEIAVEAVVPDSPAARVGLAPNDMIVAIDGTPTAALPAAEPGDWRRLKGLHDAIDAALARDGAVGIAWRGADGVAHNEAIEGVPACPSRFELLDSGGKAAADGNRVVVGRKFAGFGYAEDELAAALAHELAHNLLHHQAWLSRVGRRSGNVRLSEHEADRLMPWLLANAGYDPAAAERFFTRWGPRHDLAILRASSLEGWKKRAAAVAAELPLIRAAIADTRAADWATRFRRDTAR
jgi:hypothetical protein